MAVEGLKRVRGVMKDGLREIVERGLGERGVEEMGDELKGKWDSKRLKKMFMKWKNIKSTKLKLLKLIVKKKTKL